MSEVDAADRSSGELKSQMNTTETFSEQDKSQPVSIDRSPGELASHTRSTDKWSDEEKSRASTTDKSFGAEKEYVNTTDEPESQTRTTGMSGGQELQVGTTNKPFTNKKPQINTTDDYLDEPQSPDKSFIEENFTDRGSGEPELQTGTIDVSGAVQSQASATAILSGEEKAQEDVPDKVSGEPESQTSTTEYFGEEKPQGYATDISEPESHKDTTDKYGEFHPREGTTESFEDDKSWVHITSKASGASTADKTTDEPKPQESNIGNCPSKEVSSKITAEEFNTDKLRQRYITQSPPISGKPESQMGTTDKSDWQKSHMDVVIEERRTTTHHWLIGGITVLLVVVALVSSLHSWEGQPAVHHDSVLEIFFKEVASLKKDFPGQYEGLWFRSEKILRKHLNTSHPREPSILILTAAQDGEQTLLCVSKRLAKSYANSLRASWLIVSGPSMSKYDSATSKMQIDNELSSGFQSNSRAAVLYRLETLPPGSLLILYKYCDHENAAFKNVALVLTVLLEERSLETDLSFVEVEEKVKDLLWERFAKSEVSTHNEMDVDKLSGVWSRISHIVLPVLPVDSVESGSCPGFKD